MTKSELIDMVKRWQVAEYTRFEEDMTLMDLPSAEFLAVMSAGRYFFKITKTFLTLLNQLEPDIYKAILVKRGDLLPIDYSSFPILRITNPVPTDPGIGFCGVNYTKGDPEECSDK